jgi:hypothetical protein
MLMTFHSAAFKFQVIQILIRLFLPSTGYLFDARFINMSIDDIRANSSLIMIALVPSTILSTNLNIDGENLPLMDALKKIGVDGIININAVIRA